MEALVGGLLIGGPVFLQWRLVQFTWTGEMKVLEGVIFQIVVILPNRNINVEFKRRELLQLNLFLIEFFDFFITIGDF